jgi:hypothetical protein
MRESDGRGGRIRCLPISVWHFSLNRFLKMALDFYLSKITEREKEDD